MKSLKQLLEASLLDIDTNLNITDEEAIKSAITQFINDNYNCEQFTISKNPNKNGKYKVSSKKHVKVKNTNITSLTNDLFTWSKVEGYFDCSNCNFLKSLEGAPKEVKGDFDCSFCDLLKSLKGSPKEVGGYFECFYCKSLESLKGAPKEVGDYFSCHSCKVQFKESDVKAVSKVLTLIYV